MMLTAGISPPSAARSRGWWASRETASSGPDRISSKHSRVCVSQCRWDQRDTEIYNCYVFSQFRSQISTTRTWFPRVTTPLSALSLTTSSSPCRGLTQSRWIMWVGNKRLDKGANSNSWFKIFQTILPEILKQTPAGTSVKTVAQFAQVKWLNERDMCRLHYFYTKLCRDSIPKSSNTLTMGTRRATLR